MKKIATAIFLNFFFRLFFKPCCVHCRSKMLVKRLAQTQKYIPKHKQFLLSSSSKSQNLPAISILIKVSHFYTKTHKKIPLQLNFLLLISKIIYFYIGKFYPKKYWIFAINFFIFYFFFYGTLI